MRNEQLVGRGKLPRNTQVAPVVFSYPQRTGMLHKLSKTRELPLKCTAHIEYILSPTYIFSSLKLIYRRVIEVCLKKKKSLRL